jgi:hypothetical protein
VTTQEKWNLKSGLENLKEVVSDIFEPEQNGFPAYPDDALGTDGSCWTDAQLANYFIETANYMIRLLCQGKSAKVKEGEHGVDRR